MTAFKDVYALLANRLAATAPRAFVREICELLLRRNAFGVVTPHTTQRTPLEKERGADARSVVNRKMLDVKYVCRHALFSSNSARAMNSSWNFLSILVKYQLQPEMRT